MGLWFLILVFDELQYHPDVCRGSNCGVQFHEINEAYDVSTLLILCFWRALFFICQACYFNYIYVFLRYNFITEGIKMD